MKYNVIVASTSQMQHQYLTATARLLQWQRVNATSIRHWNVKVAMQRQHVLQRNQIKVIVLR